MKTILAVILTCLAVAGCSNLTPTQNRALGGTAAGATTGAIFGAIGGNAGLGTAIGAGVGLASGLVYDAFKKNEDSSYQKGYSAGQASLPPH